MEREEASCLLCSIGLTRVSCLDQRALAVWSGLRRAGEGVRSLTSPEGGHNRTSKSRESECKDGHPA